MSAPDTATTRAEQARRWRRSARRAWIGVIATMLAGITAGFLLPADPLLDPLIVTVVSAATAGLTARAAYRHGQLDVLARLRHNPGQEPR
ncbi:hypothetical protein [Amycolatopsis sp. NPDC004378]